MCSSLAAPTRQLSLLASGTPDLPPDLRQIQRIDLGAGAWVDTNPGWLPGADHWLDELSSTLPWRSARRRMYDRIVDVPRLMSHFDRTDERPPARLDALAGLFEEHYRRPFPTIGCNWYRDGDDSVAWHADRVERPGDSVVAIIGVGERRPFHIRPISGGATTRRWRIGDGDLIVLGGTIQANWQHAVPKVRSAGERISIMIRSSGIQPSDQML